MPQGLLVFFPSYAALKVRASRTLTLTQTLTQTLTLTQALTHTLTPGLHRRVGAARLDRRALHPRPSIPDPLSSTLY